MSKLKLTALLAAISTVPAVAWAEPPAANIRPQLARALAPGASVRPAPPQALEPAGHVLWAFGQVERIGADGAAKPLAKGDLVFEGDVIRSAPGSQAQLVMKDEALIAVRAESSLKLTKYTYLGREDGTERAILELLKGGIRSVTGAIGRNNKGNYQLKHDTHVIGIRGTDHESFVTDSGTFSRVTLGGTYLEGPGGRIDLAPGEVGFVGMRTGDRPSRLAQTPEFMHLAALGSRSTGPQPRGSTPGDERHLQKALSVSLPAALPQRPAQAMGENMGWGRGERCGGPCSDPLKNEHKGKK